MLRLLISNLICSSHISLVGRLVIISKSQATETNSKLVSYYNNSFQWITPPCSHFARWDFFATPSIHSWRLFPIPQIWAGFKLPLTNRMRWKGSCNFGFCSLRTFPHCLRKPNMAYRRMRGHMENLGVLADSCSEQQVSEAIWAQPAPSRSAYSLQMLMWTQQAPHGADRHHPSWALPWLPIYRIVSK